MSPPQPMNMRAYTTTGQGTGVIKAHPVPTPSPGQALVKIYAAALNPGDRKLIQGNLSHGGAPADLIAGFDFAGTIANSNGTKWQKGTRVAGWVHGGNPATPDCGAYSEYLAIDETLMYEIPSNIDFKSASTVPLALATALLGLFSYLKIPELNSAAQTDDAMQKYTLIYGATTSVGQYAIQISALTRFRTIAVASSAYHARLKELGADLTFDYHDSTWPEQVKSATNGTLQHALDCVGESGSGERIATSLSQSKGDHIVCLNPVDRPALQAVNPHLKAESFFAVTAFGKAVQFGVFDNEDGNVEEDYRVWTSWLGRLKGLLKEGKIVPNEVRDLGGLDDVEKGFEMSKNGQLRGVKGVFTIVRE